MIQKILVPYYIIVILVAVAIALAGCTSPSKEGLHSKMRATLPVDAEITFE